MKRLALLITAILLTTSLQAQGLISSNGSGVNVGATLHEAIVTPYASFGYSQGDMKALNVNGGVEVTPLDLFNTSELPVDLVVGADLQFNVEGPNHPVMGDRITTRPVGTAFIGAKIPIKGFAVGIYTGYKGYSTDYKTINHEYQPIIGRIYF